MKKQYLHFVITRFNIPARYAGRRNPAVAAIDPKTDEAYLDGRMALFEKYTFPSLAGQTNKESNGWYCSVTRLRRSTWTD